MIEEKYVEALKTCGADEASHSGRTLLDHLKGTYNLLKSWKNRKEVCLAGLFHSIYGTQAFKIQTVPFSERENIRKKIPGESEELAYIFCVSDRQTFFSEKFKDEKYCVQDVVNNREIYVSDRQIKDLIEIEAANCLEQLPSIIDRMPKERIDKVIDRFFRKKEFLSDGALRAIEEFKAVN